MLYNFTDSIPDVTGFGPYGASIRNMMLLMLTFYQNTISFDSRIRKAQNGLNSGCIMVINKAITRPQVDEDLDPVWTDIVFGPQTSGGLLYPFWQSETLVSEASTPGDGLMLLLWRIEASPSCPLQ